MKRSRSNHSDSGSCVWYCGIQWNGVDPQRKTHTRVLQAPAAAIVGVGGGGNPLNYSCLGVSVGIVSHAESTHWPSL